MAQVIIKRKETADQIQHGFKYINKKKVNGKWRYYYDTTGLKKELNDYKKALSSADEKKEFLKVTGTKNVDSANLTIEQLRRRRQEIADKTKKNNNILSNDEAQEDINLYEQITKIKKAKKSYEKAKTFVGKTSDLKRAFNKHNPKFAKSIKKAKKWLKNLFK